MPRSPFGVLALTVAGFVVASSVGVGAGLGGGPAAAPAASAPLARETAGARLVAAATPGFCVFVLGLGVIVAGVTERGLGRVARRALPHGTGLPALLGGGVIAAALANLVNNLPATLALDPAGVGPRRSCSPCSSE